MRRRNGTGAHRDVVVRAASDGQLDCELSVAERCEEGGGGSQEVGKQHGRAGFVMGSDAGQDEHPGADDAWKTRDIRWGEGSKWLEA